MTFAKKNYRKRKNDTHSTALADINDNDLKPCKTLNIKKLKLKKA